MPDPVALSAPPTALNIEIVFGRLAGRGEQTLLWTSDGEISASAVLGRSLCQIEMLRNAKVKPGAICAFVGDYSLHTTAMFISLASIGAIAVPFSAGSTAEHMEMAAEAGVEFWIDPVSGAVRESSTVKKEPHPLVVSLISAGHPGLVVFTSGSSGRPKAILHDVDRVASKFVKQRPARRMVLFLLMDHFGGFNTLLSVLANDGTGVCPAGRTPRAVCESIVASKADLLPTTPTFLGMLIASGLWKNYDLSSIRLVTYGAEPMPPQLLARAREILPDAEFKQTYGLSELGVLRSASPDQDTLWLRIGGDGFETKIVEGQLFIRSASNMLGYLNAPNPIDSQGWMNTGDLVEEHGGLIRFLGRSSEIINVGGQKVMPTEIENVLLEADGVTGAVVKGIPHPLLGNAIIASVSLIREEDLKLLSERLRLHCRERLQKYKIPMRFEIAEMDSLATSRAKKNRGG